MSRKFQHVQVVMRDGARRALFVDRYYKHRLLGPSLREIYWQSNETFDNILKLLNITIDYHRLSTIKTSYHADGHFFCNY